MHLRMYIDGEATEAASGRTRDILNPGTGEVTATAADGDASDARRAIAAARTAFAPWAATPAETRADLLDRLAELVQRDREELAALETRDTGKTLEESRWDMDDVTDVLRYYAQLARTDHDEILEAPSPSGRSRLVREPVGVCGMILPWNYPLLQASWKLAPALAAGCTMVMKPSELTPMTTVRITELAQEAGFPRGVVNTVLGPGNSVGAELAESRDVDLISFTGGVKTGKSILRAASSNVKKVALELGGKNPHIIFADADLDVAVDQALGAVFFHAGQICSAGARLMLQDSIHDAFVERLVARIGTIRVGVGTDPASRMGPLISAEHRASVERRVAQGVADGARLRVGGKRPADPALQTGFFFEPTLFDRCTADMDIVREEVFGPVITVESFETEEEVVALANDTDYGLSAGFWTQDRARIQRVSRALRFGTVWVNAFNVYFAAAPWGGYKQSGMGRELGRVGLDEYTECKHVYEDTAPEPLGWFE